MDDIVERLEQDKSVLRNKINNLGIIIKNLQDEIVGKGLEIEDRDDKINELRLEIKDLREHLKREININNRIREIVN